MRLMLIRAVFIFTQLQNKLSLDIPVVHCTGFEAYLGSFKPLASGTFQLNLIKKLYMYKHVQTKSDPIGFDRGHILDSGKKLKEERESRETTQVASLMNLCPCLFPLKAILPKHISLSHQLLTEAKSSCLISAWFYAFLLLLSPSCLVNCRPRPYVLWRRWHAAIVCVGIAVWG